MSAETTQLSEPIQRPGKDDVTEVSAHRAEVAAAMAAHHPPTNPNVLIDALDYWSDIVSANDPIVRTLSSWLCYQVNDDVSQFDAGITCDQHSELQDRLEELGIADAH